jgi:hypothetical protein
VPELPVRQPPGGLLGAYLLEAPFAPHFLLPFLGVIVLPGPPRLGVAPGRLEGGGAVDLLPDVPVAEEKAAERHQVVRPADHRVEQLAHRVGQVHVLPARVALQLGPRDLGFRRPPVHAEAAVVAADVPAHLGQQRQLLAG